MSGNDDFDDLFDAFREKKKSASKPKSSFSPNKDFEDLPIWKEIKDTTSYVRCNICKRDLDDEDIVETCTSCERYYHFRHIREWLKIKPNCPSCRQ